jgi:uncharacterized membrane protein YgaE (UPF0421/DUF939 family)
MEAIVQAITTLGPMLAGPGAAVVVLILLGAGVGFIWVRYLLPLIAKKLDQDHQALQTIMSSHDEDRKVFRESISDLTKSLNKMDKRLGRVEDAVEKITNDVIELPCLNPLGGRSQGSRSDCDEKVIG